MLKIFDRPAAGSNFCDGHSRRTFLQIGALGGLTLPQLLQAQSGHHGLHVWRASSSGYV